MSQSFEKWAKIQWSINGTFHYASAEAGYEQGTKDTLTWVLSLAEPEGDQYGFSGLRSIPQDGIDKIRKRLEDQK